MLEVSYDSEELGQELKGRRGNIAELEAHS